MDIARGTPSSLGIAPAGIAALVDALDADPRIDPHGLIVQRHGVRAAEAYWRPHAAGRARLVYSVSKSFTSAALGLQIGEGRLGLDDLVADHLPDEMAGADPRTRSLRIRHIASMSTGHDREMLLEATAADADDPVRGFFSIPPDHEPGTRFAYSQPTVLALATILQRQAGERLSDHLRPRLLDPLGIGPFSWAEVRPGLQPGYTGVFTDLDAVARLGQLHLDDGVHDGRRILPEGWVAQASSVQVPNPAEPHPDWQQGYGFGLWRSRHGYRGDGAFGQLMVVLPDHDVVVAVFADTAEMQVELDHVWRHLLPALGDGPRPASDADDELAARLDRLAVPTAAARVGGGDPRPWGATRLTGRRPTHPTVTAVDVDDDQLVLHEGDDRIEVPLRPDWTAVADRPISASATTDAEGRLVVDLVFVETPHRLEVVLDPSDATFSARWPALPLFGLGVGPSLSRLAAPAT